MTTLGLPAALETAHGRMKASLVLAALLAPCLMGLAVAYSSATVVLGLLAAVAAVACLSWRPSVAGFVLLVLTSTVLTIQYVPKVELRNGQGFLITEVLLAGYVGYRGLRLLFSQERTFRVQLPEILLAIFMVEVLLSVYSAVSSGRVEFPMARDFGRRYLLYASFFIFIGTIRDEHSFRRMLSVLQVLAAAAALLTIAQAIVGRDTRLFLGDPAEYIQGSGNQFPRVRPPAFYLIYALFVPTLATIMTARRGWQWAQGLCLVLYSAAILISQQRIVWIAVPAGLLMYLVLVSGAMRARTLRIAAAAVLPLAVAAVGLAQVLPDFTGTAMERLAEFGSRDDVNTADKLVEYHLAFEQIKQAPLFGSGPGIDFGATTGDVLGSVYAVVKPYTHNAYVNITLYFGLLGLATFLTFIVLAAAPAVSALRRQHDSALGNLTAATLAGVGVVLVSAMAMAVLDYPGMVPVLTFLLAGLRALQRTALAEAEAPEPHPAAAHVVPARTAVAP